MAVASLSGYTPKRRFDQLPWTAARIEGSALDAGPWTEVETFTFDNQDPDPSEPTIRNFTTELVDAATTNWLRVVFLDADGNQDATDALALTTTGNLTTASDVGRRLARDMTDAEVMQCDLLINSATINILACLDRDPTTWTPPAKVKPLLAAMCTEIVTRVIVNPEDLQRRRETIGTYMIDEMFANRGAQAPGIAPTQTEELVMRNAVFGTNTGSVKVRSMVNELADLFPSGLTWSLWWTGYPGIRWIV
jgi:hypothetical protein